nr:uncharacterized protein LOC111413133 [Onthophagus taurus]XP_022899763.1 uncharacterized protein LOC111413133 [Onthophagus taurus]XP_022899765.1 uncharacterized protein LOC111413133 [Onthophagus taurus]XP_022899766.1 uncharacterized protein LOC111413133 [Onthophagus taurus]XP_022899767.1 uncharacterized protein LOC111413133 [Onthophagus taurus]XP_022899768.1 uncharacterized protein LOC111413133 [Onthophagus taurus]XP_022899769.1 uncharacterized protein LOC111413133 [Onthophagus taurus]XP_0
MNTSKIFLIVLVSSLNLSVHGSYDEYYKESVAKFGEYLTVFSNYLKGPIISDPIYDKDVEIYDFIIVGAGTAGCVLANRLSKIWGWKILLLEAGIPENPIGKIPVIAPILQTTQYNWHYKTIPQKTGCLGMINNTCNQISGKSMGGSSAINDNIYTIGNQNDYNEWSKTGNNSNWSYTKVLPYFKKAEHVNLYDYDEDYHGKDGPINTELQKNPSKIRKPFLKALKQLNYSILDYNGMNQIGFNDPQVTTFHGKRRSVSSAYLEGLERDNLIIKTSSYVEKILFKDDKKVVGVVYRRNDKYLIAKARKEVILSSGVFNTVKILQLSGIGPEDELNKLGIKTKINLPVGKNFKDHVAFLGLHFVFNCQKFNDITSKDNILNWLFYGEGELTSCGIDVLGFLNSRLNTNRNHPDLEIAVSPINFNQNYRIIHQLTNFNKTTYDSFWQNTEFNESFTVLVILSRPKSVGTVKIKSENPHDSPLIDPKYLEHPDDVETILDGIKKVLEIANTTEFRRLNATLNERMVEGCDRFRSLNDDYWRCAIRRLHVGVYHGMGTCKMSTKDDGGVVDERLRVYGVENLRVVDASVIPNAITPHTMAPVVMIGEKAADIIKEDWEH